MTYSEAIQYLYDLAPMFQQVGSKGYKTGLDNTLALDAHFHHPHSAYRTIHIAGTNGKGSTAHSLAAVLQRLGLKVGLYTSPHLIDFRERIRVNGEMIPADYVAQFVETERHFFAPLQPSFFEITTALAFKYFADAGVDVAVIEVGLGGRLDCTNIIKPCLSIVTNISLDHTALLGDSLEAIAHEKAGIFKSGIPALVGEATEETRKVFKQQADTVGCPLTFAEDQTEVLSHQPSADGRVTYDTRHYNRLTADLAGDCQPHNMNTVLHALQLLEAEGLFADHATMQRAAAEALPQVCALTGLMGRWQTLKQSPMVVCDTGHNPGGWEYLGRRLNNLACDKLHIVFGMAADKDISTVLSALPTRAVYYFTQASVRRAMPADELQTLAAAFALSGQAYANVATAYEAALKAAEPTDFIFVGGSSFIVADLLTMWQQNGWPGAELSPQTS